MGKMSGQMCGVAAFLIMVFSAPVCFGQALDQLQDAYNTGVTFDGSDGDRFGMDTGISSPGDVPEPSAPEPVYAEPVYQEPEPVYQEPEPVYQEPEPVYQEPEPVREGTYDADN